MFLPTQLNSGRNYSGICHVGDTTLNNNFKVQKLHFVMIQVLSKPLPKF